jgi:ATP-dependent RNA circularization protein (DNA/RNA ligase family)
MKYPKINNLRKRDQVTRKFIDNTHSCDEFGIIKNWMVEEKIDGMNIRIVIDGSCYSYARVYGRTDEALVPKQLVHHICSIFTPEKIKELSYFMNSNSEIILFCEGYGPKIQTGGNYRDEMGFILFDVWSVGRWSSREEVQSIAILLEMPMPHSYGLMTTDKVIELVKSKPDSPTAIRPMKIEGVMCRSHPLIINNYTRDMVMFKLKCKDM